MDIEIVDPETWNVCPPPYKVEPTVIPSPTHAAFLEAIFLISQPTRIVDFGKMVQGKLSILPKEDIMGSSVTFTLRGIEAAVKPKKLKDEKIFQRQYSFPLATVPLAIEGPMKAGFRYEFNFSFQFPERPTRPVCKCGFEHSPLPPSLGHGSDAELSGFNASVRYFFVASIDGTQFTTRSEQYLWPATSLLTDFLSVADKDGRSLQREYVATNTVFAKTGLLKKKEMGAVTLRGDPLFHSSVSETGTLLVRMDCSEVLGLENFEHFVTGVNYEIQKICFSAPDGMRNCFDETETNTVTRFKIGGGKCCFAARWTDRNAIVSLNYKLPDRMLLIPLTYLSCYSGVHYEMVVTVKHRYGSSVVTLPMLIVESCLPNYGEIDTHGDILISRSSNQEQDTKQVFVPPVRA